MTPASIADYRALSRRRVPRFLFDYTDGGSYAEATLAANEADLAAITLDQRVMVDVSRVDTATRLLGQNLAMPVILAPVGLGGLHARRGEVQAMRAAMQAGVAMALSTVSVCSLGEVTAAAGAPPWFQLYLVRDRGANAAMIEAARTHNCPALVLTVDLPTPGARYRDVRSSLTGAPGLAGWLHRAAQAVAHGADAIVVSNHGGRQLDGAMSAVKALPAILDRLGGAIPVLADGGVRSGLDVLRFVRLGAAAVLVGRPWVWGLGARGQAGVAHVLQILKAELETAMALTGQTSLG